MSKFSTPFFKKSPLFGAYENAADGQAFMGGLVTGQEQFAQLQQDITKGFNNYMEGQGTQQRLEKKSLENLNKLDEASNEYESAKAAHDKRFGGVEKENKEARKKLLEWLNDPANKDATASQIAAYKTALGI
tara:strand:+ start:1062 stop:1457 length:396 start_codon:yes stop_codon:yes gene_type:complete